MNIPNKDQIISMFKASSIVIKDSDDNKRYKDLVVVIHPDYGIKYFPTYYTAYDFYSRLNLVK
jgi:hypothetical protein